MSQNQHLDRARLLMQQSRYELAEEQLRLSLAENSSDAESHSLLSLCLLSREQFAESEDEARQAIVNAPDEALGFYALAGVQQKRGQLTEAYETIHEAIRLDPWNEIHWGLLAGIEYARYRWQDCLNAAVKGLECNPDDATCTNLQAMALVKLGRREDAGATIAEALSRDPDNELTHANQGWRLLHERKPDQAMIHFREALRLDPNLEWARQGIVEAMKARHFIYRWMLAFFLWRSRLPPRFQIALVLGLVFGNQILAAVCQAVPLLNPLRGPIIVGYLLFAWMSWVSSTLFNAVLCLNRFGRLALNRREKIDAACAVGCVGLAGLTGLTGHVVGSGFSASEFWLVGLLWLGLVIPLSNAFHLMQLHGRRWFWMMLYSAGLAVVILAAYMFAIRMATGMASLQAQYPGKLTGADLLLVQSKVQDLAAPFVTWFQRGVNGVVLSTWLGIILRAVPNRR
jgi:tetratricopeptide (TPR) repeat protein